MKTKTHYVLTVVVPTESVFNAYWYGIGDVISSIFDPYTGQFTYRVDYGDDGYRAGYQAGRFQSGLYFAKVQVETWTTPNPDIFGRNVLDGTE